MYDEVMITFVVLVKTVIFTQLPKNGVIMFLGFLYICEFIYSTITSECSNTFACIGYRYNPYIIPNKTIVFFNLPKKCTCHHFNSN